jgi:hypothetical protein
MAKHLVLSFTNSVCQELAASRSESRARVKPRLGLKKVRNCRLAKAGSCKTPDQEHGHSVYGGEMTYITGQRTQYHPKQGHEK